MASPGEERSAQAESRRALDNLSVAPSRPLGVRPGDLETELQACLKRRAALTPPPTEMIADAVIRRARAARRRKAAAGALIVTVIATLAVTGSWPIGVPGRSVVPPVAAPEWPTADPTVVDTPSPVATIDAAPLPSTFKRDLLAGRTLPVDVVVADQLLTAKGGRVDLAAVGAVDEAYQVDGGWLVLSRAKSGTALWYVTVDAVPRSLLTAVDGVVVAPAGDRVAWREDSRVYVGALRSGRVEVGENRLTQSGVMPVSFVGKGLLLARRQAEELTGSYAMWWPGKGDAALRWRVTSGVYGALPDGRTVVAQVPGARDGQPCLALLDAVADLVVRALSCDVPMITGAGGAVSPDGRWLVAERTVAESVFVDVDSAFGKRPAAVAQGPRPNGPGAWTDDGTVVYGGSGCLSRLRLDRAAAGEKDVVERIAVHGGGREPVLAVPRLAG